MQIIIFFSGLFMLIIGAEVLIRGASRLAASIGISPLIIGLTVVAFGTSSPELAVSIKSVLTGKPGISIGNVIGSNIFNVLFILGLSAVIAPLIISQQLIRFDVPIMIFLAVLVFLFSFDGNISRWEGAVLFTLLVTYISYLFVKNKKNPETGDELAEKNKPHNQGLLNSIIDILLILAGLLLLFYGSKWLVDSAAYFAKQIGISEVVIGLTIVAIGTSLPEGVTSIVASLKGERDIAVGNVVGSNIFNTMGVLGIAGIFSRSGIDISPSVAGFDIPIMVAVCFACLPVFFTGGKINRWEGLIFFGFYIVYTVYLILHVTDHDMLPVYNSVVLYFLIPITFLTVAWTVFQEFQKIRKQKPKRKN